MFPEEVRLTGEGYFSDSKTFGGTPVSMRLDLQVHGKGRLIVRLLDAKGYASQEDKDMPAESGIYLTTSDVEKIARWLADWLKETVEK
jgi:hypothetical protein